MRMGQNSSVPTGIRRGRRKSFRESWRSPFPRRSQTHQGTLSAAFNFNDVDLKVDQLNVNTASEEELMTLPGISRSIAQNIVEYRLAIGRFKKVEDLALVSGIGAEKLDLIRPEICVSRRKNASCASSRAQSMDSLPSTESNNFSRLYLKGSPHTQNRGVNINIATVFELMSVHGLNQELAANIVEYRDKKGPFQTLEELVKVKGINQWRLGALRSHLVVQNLSDGAHGSSHTMISSSLGSVQNIANGKISNSTRKISSGPLKCSSTNGFLPGKDIFELLSAYSQRPILEEDFHGIRNGKVALRIATWNLQDFTLEKVENPGVKEIICRTILENSFSLIAVQEITDGLSLKQVIILQCEAAMVPWSFIHIAAVLAKVYRNPDKKQLLCEGCRGHSGISHPYHAQRMAITRHMLRTNSMAPLLPHNICDELNCPTLRRVIDWKDNEREWKYALPLPHESDSKEKLSAGLGFLYDTSCQVELVSMKELYVKGSSSVEAVLATFKVGDLRISVLNMCIQKSDVYSIERVVQGHVKLTDMLIILGDFTGLSQSKGESEISRLQYKSVIPTSCSTHSSTGDPQASHYCDNIFLNAELQLQYTGVSGVVRQGLNHLAIPRGWMWGGTASDHCPVWCEVYTEPVLAEKVLPNGMHHLE